MPSQAARQVAVNSSLGDDVLLFRRMVAHEELGRLFELHLEVLSEKHDIKFDDVLGTNMTVRLTLADATVRYFNGYVGSLRYQGTSGRFALYAVVLKPWLWFLTRTADCRIFQEQTVPDIVKQVFRDSGFSSAFSESLSGSYRTWEYCVQYRETAFDFVSRLMEQEGIYYFFTHENGKHTLVLADAYSAHSPFPGYATATYLPPDANRALLRESVAEFSVGQYVQTGGYALRDFDFEAPKKALQSLTPANWKHEGGSFEVFDYPGKYTETSDGNHYSRVNMEALGALHERVSGSGNVRALAAGSLVTLEGHPRTDQNREYLLIATDYRITSDDYESTAGAAAGPDIAVDFTAMPAAVQFRSERVTRKPIVQGPQTAIVVGKSGEEIWVDKYGRIKVLFHWDRYGKADETSSCWVRVTQVWAGKKWGGQALPRIGQEVIVDFLEGDPDRPIVTGRVYNGDCMPGYELPANATMTGIKSNSSKGGGGFNELRFEDKKGEEQVFIHAEKNFDLRVKNDRFETIGNNHHLIVTKDKLEEVKNKRHVKVGVDHLEEIGGDRHLKVKGKEAVEVVGSCTLTVTGDMAHVFKANHTEKTTSNYFLKALGVVIESSSGITLKCGGNSVVLDPSGVTIKGSLVTLDGSMVNIASAPGSPPTPGSPGSPVSPTAPTAPEEADQADPGEVAEAKAEQLKTKSGKYGSVQVTPFQAPSPGQGGGAGPGGGATGSSQATSSFASAQETQQTQQTQQDNTHWIEIELVDEAGKPVPGEPYEITLPDASLASGTLDEQGKARVEGITSGQCQVSFPKIDKTAWEDA